MLADGIYIDRSGLPPPLVARLVRLAAFQNPEFYRAQAMRLSTFGKPRIISCAELHPHHIGAAEGMPRRGAGAAPVARHRNATSSIAARRERPWRSASWARCAMGRPPRWRRWRSHDCGVLAATTAFGKTVVAAALIARRGRNTLVLVHRRQLVEQWVERLRAFLVA